MEMVFNEVPLQWYLNIQLCDSGSYWCLLASNMDCEGEVLHLNLASLMKGRDVLIFSFFDALGHSLPIVLPQIPVACGSLIQCILLNR